jgi:hypothetical protein
MSDERTMILNMKSDILKEYSRGLLRIRQYTNIQLPDKSDTEAEVKLESGSKNHRRRLNIIKLPTEIP